LIYFHEAVLNSADDGAANAPAAFVNKARVLLDAVTDYSMSALLQLSDGTQFLAHVGHDALSGVGRRGCA
jgi:hypothetical protein